MKDKKFNRASSKFEHIPEGLQEIYTMPNINDSILLYDGPINMEQNGKKTSESGQIKFRWLPVPGPRFPITLAHSPEYMIELGAMTITTPEAINSSKALLDNEKSYSKNNKSFWEASGWFSTLEIGNLNKLCSVLFHVPNFIQYLGANIREPGESGFRRGRVIITGGEWQITLDSLPNTTHKFIERLSSNGGYAITHIGKFSKLNGGYFSPAEAMDLLGSLAYFLSFCRGVWIAPILPVGMDSKGTRTWEQWRDWRIDRFLKVQSWINQFGAESISNSFPGFVGRITDETWGEPISLSIWWYLECNKRVLSQIIEL